MIMPSSGGLHPKASLEIVKLYEEMYETIRQVFPEKKLSRFFPLEGYRYNEFSQIKNVDSFLESGEAVERAKRLMVVGRSVNGWTELSEKSAKDFSNSMVDAIIPGGNGFDWLNSKGLAKETYIDKNGIQKRYNINKSAFFRCIRGVIQELKPESSVEERWFEHIVWTNLYTVAPLYSGNASGRLKDIQVDLSRKILLEQIKHYRPTHILFITDWDYWFEQFSVDYPSVKKTGESSTDNIVGSGVHGDIKVVVSIRPDRTVPNKPNERLLVEDIVHAFGEVKSDTLD